MANEWLPMFRELVVDDFNAGIYIYRLDAGCDDGRQYHTDFRSEDRKDFEDLSSIRQACAGKLQAHLEQLGYTPSKLRQLPVPDGYAPPSWLNAQR